MNTKDYELRFILCVNILIDLGVMQKTYKAQETDLLITQKARGLLTVNSCIKVHLDSQADKSSVVVNRRFFPQVWTQGIESVEQCVTQDPI
jgi:hypothetical protein